MRKLEAIRLVAAAAGLSVLRTSHSYVVGPPAEIQKAAAGLGDRRLVPLQFLTPAQVRQLAPEPAPSMGRRSRLWFQREFGGWHSTSTLPSQEPAHPRRLRHSFHTWCPATT